MPPLATLDGPHDDLSRRRFLAVAATAGLLTACGSDAASNPAAPAAGAWTFTDDRSVTVSLDSRPERIVSYDTAGSALWRLGVKPIGIFAGTPLADSPSLAGLDLRGVETVGEVYGQIDLEKLAALRPDLIVTAFDPRQTGPVFGFANADVQDKAQSLAPIVAIDGIKDPIFVINRFEELAEALGADLQAPELATARRRFQQASEELRAALAAKPGLLAVALSKSEDEVSFAPSAGLPGALTDIPTLRTSAAVRLRQLVPWRKLEDWSYQTYATDIGALLAGVRRANPDLVT